MCSLDMSQNQKVNLKPFFMQQFKAKFFLLNCHPGARPQQGLPGFLQRPVRQGHLPLDSRGLESQDCAGDQGGQTAFDPVHALPHEIRPREAIQWHTNHLAVIGHFLGHLWTHFDVGSIALEAVCTGYILSVARKGS